VDALVRAHGVAGVATGTGELSGWTPPLNSPYHPATHGLVGGDTEAIVVAKRHAAKTRPGVTHLHTRIAEPFLGRRSPCWVRQRDRKREIG
jgi:hypothetical protein